MEMRDGIEESKKTTWWLPAGIVVVLIGLIGGLSYWATYNNKANGEQIKIGIITDLSGPAAYWGASTRVGADIAKRELNEAGYSVEIIYEDYQLDAAKALTSAQKLVNVDNVDAVYAEFNPAAVSAGSFMKTINKTFMYDAAVTSPLEGNPNAFKTYLDYQVGCKDVAQKFKDQGVTKVGSLKVNLEAGNLCQAGLEEVFDSSNITTEVFNLGDTDFKTQILKMKNSGVGAIIGAMFEGDTLNTLKAIKELGFDVPYGTVDDSVTDKVKQQYSDELKGAWTFGFPPVSVDFSAKVKANANTTLSTEYGAALAYTHILQIAKSIDACKKDLVCSRDKISQSTSDDTVGFIDFKDRVANLKLAIKKY
ncbi:MAG: ABC transporter substrate-binding protein [Candidatus Berkelbacteria bacterium]|nr:ABC transporter substrate-binding protein [Candidatus Berkelbacteria bacterium]MCR4307309.1 ABC transporter substrate-binding protein [Candidatus Berkelbacteria bacterium]